MACRSRCRSARDPENSRPQSSSAQSALKNVKRPAALGRPASSVTDRRLRDDQMPFLPAALRRWLDVHGALTTPARVLRRVVVHPLTLGQVVERHRTLHAGGMEKHFLPILGLDEAEAAVADDTNDGTLHVPVPLWFSVGPRLWRRGAAGLIRQPERYPGTDLQRGQDLRAGRADGRCGPLRGVATDRRQERLRACAW